MTVQREWGRTRSVYKDKGVQWRQCSTKSENKKSCRKLNVTQVTHIQSMEFVDQQRERRGGGVGDLHSTGREWWISQMN